MDVISVNSTVDWNPLDEIFDLILYARLGDTQACANTPATNDPLVAVCSSTREWDSAFVIVFIDQVDGSAQLVKCRAVRRINDFLISFFLKVSTYRVLQKIGNEARRWKQASWSLIPPFLQGIDATNTWRLLREFSDWKTGPFIHLSCNDHRFLQNFEGHSIYATTSVTCRMRSRFPGKDAGKREGSGKKGKRKVQGGNATKTTHPTEMGMTCPHCISCHRQVYTPWIHNADSRFTKAWSQPHGQIVPSSQKLWILWHSPQTSDSGMCG